MLVSLVALALVVIAAAPQPAWAEPAAVEYRLPLPAGTSALVTQGNAGPFTHQHRGFSEFAWDFALPTGSMVCAAADGTVVAVEDNNRAGGTEDVYLSRANYVVLSHEDGLYSLYLHLAYRGSLVGPGQRVRSGQGIALSGATGYATGPHLHFKVQETASAGRSWSVPISFADAGIPAYATTPVSNNVYLPGAGDPRAMEPGLTFPGLVHDLPPTLYTHQGLTLGLDWTRTEADSTEVQSSGGSAAIVRLVLADGDGDRTVVATAATGLGGHLEGRVEAAVEGPVTLWAEYGSGNDWRVLGTSTGELLTLTSTAVAHDVFVAHPGLAVTGGGPAGEAGGAKIGDTFEIAFTVVNLGDGPHRLRDLTLRVTTPRDSPVNGSIPVIKDVYLAPGRSRTWEGRLTVTTPGEYQLEPSVNDSAARALELPPVDVGLPASGLIVVADNEPPPSEQTFADVSPDHPAYAAIEVLAARGVVGGYPGPDGTRLFRPDDPVTRAQFAKLVVQALSLPVSEDDLCPFVDVEVSGPDTFYPDNYVAVAAAAGITLGTAVDPPRFSPYTQVTRRQAATMVDRARPGSQATIPGDQYGPATRAEAAQLVARLLD